MTVRLRRAIALLTVLGAVLALSLPATAQSQGYPRQVRLVVTAFKQDLSQAESYADFRQAVFDHFDTHVVPLLADERPNLVVYPERLDQLAALVGQRGQVARSRLREGETLTTARLWLYGPYAPQIGYYRGQYGGLTETQYLQLAMTDTIVRALVESFADLARHGGVHVVVGGALPEYRVATAAEATAVGDVEADGPAYVATSPAVAAQTLVLSPQGEIVATRPKLYLESRERSDGTTGEGLTAGGFRDLRVIDLPFVRLGIAAGSDALMPDVGARLEQQGAEILVQPLRHGRWGASQGSISLWPPDRFRRGTWIQVQRHPGLRAAGTAVLTGALGSEVRDGQPAISGPSSASQHGDSCLVGSGREPGWLAIGPWADVGLEGLDVCEPTSRPDLDEAANAQLYTREVGVPYYDGAVATDVLLSPRTTHPPVRQGSFTSGPPVDPEGIQLWPSLSVGSSGARLAWVRELEGARRVVSADGRDGVSWSEPVVVWPLATGSPHVFSQGPPAVAHARRQEHDTQPGLSVSSSLDAEVTFPILDGRDWDIYSSQHDEADESWGSRLRVDRGPSERFFGDRDDALRANAEVDLEALPDGSFAAVWSDLRWPFARPRVRIAIAPNGEAWEGRARVDGGPPDPDEETAVQPRGLEPGETRGQFSPSVVATGSGTLVVAWHEPTDQGGPAIRVARSTDGGMTFEPPRVVDGTGSASWRPDLAVAGDEVWLGWESATQDGGREVVVAVSDDAGATWGAAERIDRARPPGVTQQDVSVAADDLGAVLAFRDDRTGTAHLLAAAVDRIGGVFGPVRVDDAPLDRAVRAAAMDLREDGRLLVAWQEGQGAEDVVRTAVGALDRGPAGVSGSERAGDVLPATGGGALAGVALLAAAWVLRPRSDIGRRSRAKSTVTNRGSRTYY